MLPTFASCAARKTADVHVFYYTYSDPYISTVRSSLDGFLRSENIRYQDQDRSMKTGIGVIPSEDNESRAIRVVIPLT